MMNIISTRADSYPSSAKSVCIWDTKLTVTLPADDPEILVLGDHDLDYKIETYFISGD